MSCLGLWLCCLTFAVVMVVSIDVDEFEVALEGWSEEQRRFYADFEAGTPWPPAKGHMSGDSRGTHHSEKVNQRVDVSKKRSPVAEEIDALDADGSSSSDANAGDSTSADSDEQRFTATTRRTTRVQTQQPSTARPARGRHDGGQDDAPDTTVMSFSDACGQDASERCGEPNPFNATFCLVSKKESLSKTCRDHLTAKVNCYLSTNKMCAGISSRLRCLYQNRFSYALPGLCTRTKFFEYIRSGPTIRDIMLDQAAEGSS